MKKLLIGTFALLFACAFTFSSFARQSGEERGKTYYDTEKTKPKEVFQTREVVSILGGQMTSKVVKHGMYFFYYENGKVKMSGNYKDDQKDGEWKYYDEKGKLTKTEYYENGQIQK